MNQIVPIKSDRHNVGHLPAVSLYINISSVATLKLIAQIFTLHALMFPTWLFIYVLEIGWHIF